MSTRATVHFADAGGNVAIVYRHSDGYPEGLGQDLERFLTVVATQISDTRFNDPSYLAAKFVVWQAGQYNIASHGNSPLNFLGVGVVLEDPGDIEYRYTVLCGNGGRPPVTWEKT